MKEILIIGVDVSKATLDIFVKPTGLVTRIDNHLRGFKKWLPELKKICFAESKILVVMEHTGQYSYRFETFLARFAKP
jgi:transposase